MGSSVSSEQWPLSVSLLHSASTLSLPPLYYILHNSNTNKHYINYVKLSINMLNKCMLSNLPKYPLKRLLKLKLFDIWHLNLSLSQWSWLLPLTFKSDVYREIWVIYFNWSSVVIKIRKLMFKAKRQRNRKKNWKNW